MSKLLIALTKVLFVLAKVLGILPFGYSFRQRVATASIPWLCYTAAIVIAIAAFGVPVVSTLQTRIVFLQKQVLLFFVGTNRFLITLLCSALTLFAQLLKHRNAIYCCNEAARIFDSICALPTDGARLTFKRNFMLRVALKAMNICLLTQMTVFFIVHDDAVYNLELLFAYLVVYFCQMTLVMTLNVFFGATLVLIAFTRHLNKRLSRICRDIRALGKQPGRFNSLKMQKYCQFADALDEVMELRRQVGALGLTVNQQFQMQVPIFLLSLTFEVSIQCYIMYFVVTDDEPCAPKMDFEPRPMLYVLGWFLDLALVMGATEQLQRSCEETRWIVRVAAEVKNVDVRLERTLEMFSFYLHKESSAQASGKLFATGNRCIFTLSERILTLTLILMQFDAVIKQKK